MKKQGFSLVELMIFMLFITLIIAASAPMISRRFSEVPSRAVHGIYMCYRNEDNVLYQARYNSTRKVYDNPVDENAGEVCSFEPPKKAAFFKVQVIGGGSGGYNYWNVDLVDNGEEHTYRYDPFNSTVSSFDGIELLYPEADIVKDGYNNRPIGIQIPTGAGGNSHSLTIPIKPPQTLRCKLGVTQINAQGDPVSGNFISSSNKPGENAYLDSNTHGITTIYPNHPLFSIVETIFGDEQDDNYYYEYGDNPENPDERIITSKVLINNSSTVYKRQLEMITYLGNPENYSAYNDELVNPVFSLEPTNIAHQKYMDSLCYEFGLYSDTHMDEYLHNDMSVSEIPRIDDASFDFSAYAKEGTEFAEAFNNGVLETEANTSIGLIYGGENRVLQYDYFLDLDGLDTTAEIENYIKNVVGNIRVGRCTYTDCKVGDNYVMERAVPQDGIGNNAYFFGSFVKTFAHSKAYNIVGEKFPSETCINGWLNGPEIWNSQTEKLFNYEEKKCDFIFHGVDTFAMTQDYSEFRLPALKGLDVISHAAIAVPLPNGEYGYITNTNTATGATMSQAEFSEHIPSLVTSYPGTPGEPASGVTYSENLQNYVSDTNPRVSMLLYSGDFPENYALDRDAIPDNNITNYLNDEGKGAVSYAILNVLYKFTDKRHAVGVGGESAQMHTYNVSALPNDCTFTIGKAGHAISIDKNDTDASLTTKVNTETTMRPRETVFDCSTTKTTVPGGNYITRASQAIYEKEYGGFDMLKGIYGDYVVNGDSVTINGESNITTTGNTRNNKKVYDMNIFTDYGSDNISISFGKGGNSSEVIDKFLPVRALITYGYDQTIEDPQDGDLVSLNDFLKYLYQVAFCDGSGNCGMNEKTKKWVSLAGVDYDNDFSDWEDQDGDKVEFKGATQGMPGAVIITW